VSTLRIEQQWKQGKHQFPASGEPFALPTKVERFLAACPEESLQALVDLLASEPCRSHPYIVCKRIWRIQAEYRCSA
jgi:hypothetical protein